ncbi:MAG: hypothetical protein AABW92_02505 [Nanoarchaeota archaeon]
MINYIKQYNNIDLMLQTTIYYSRINLVKIIQDYETKDEKFVTEKIVDLIKNKDTSEVIESSHKWVFGDIEEVNGVLIAKLGKIRKRECWFIL